MVFLAASLTGCAATSGTGDSDAAFGNFLVVGVAGNYDSRAQFERMVVSGLRSEGASAQPYHVVVGGNKPLTREAVLEAIDEHGFDAVVVTRLLDAESDLTVRSTVTGTKVSRKDGGFANLFRYDYEEFDDPLSLTIGMKLTIQTELYSSASQSMIWSTEAVGPRAENLGLLIDETAKIVVRQLRRSGKIAR
jgi:hypothetical protein